MIIKLYIVIPLMRTLQSLVSSLGFGGGGAAETGKDYAASGFHSGGIVGSEHSFQRSVDANLFNFAPRFHNGLRPDEYPAILQRGEGVFTRGQMAAMGGGQPKINITMIESKDRSGQVDSQQNDNGSMDITLFVDSITAKNLANKGSATNSVLGVRNRLSSR